MGLVCVWIFERVWDFWGFFNGRWLWLKFVVGLYLIFGVGVVGLFWLMLKIFVKVLICSGVLVYLSV